MRLVKHRQQAGTRGLIACLPPCLSAARFPVCLPASMPASLPPFPNTCLSICLSAFLNTCLSGSRPLCLPPSFITYLLTCLSASLYTWSGAYVYLFACLPALTCAVSLLNYLPFCQSHLRLHKARAGAYCTLLNEHGDCDNGGCFCDMCVYSWLRNCPSFLMVKEIG